MADCIVENEVLSKTEETRPGNEQLESTTNTVSPADSSVVTEVSVLNSDSLSCDDIASTRTFNEKQDTLNCVNVDVQHTQLGVSNLNDYSLSSNDIANIQIHQKKEVFPNGMEVDVLPQSQLEVSNLNNDLLSCDDIANIQNPRDKQDSANGMNVDVLQQSQLEVSNLNRDSLNCNDIASIQTPHEKQDSLSGVDILQNSQFEVSNLNGDSLSYNDIASIQTHQEKEDSSNGMEVDVIQQSHLEVSNLNSDLLSCHDIASIQNPRDKRDSANGMDVDVLQQSQLEISNLNGDSLSSNDIASIQTHQEKEDSPNGMEVDVIQQSQLEVLNLNSDLLSCDDIANIQNPCDKQDSLNDAEGDVSQSVLEKTYSSQNEDYQISDIVWAKIGKYPFWPSVVCVDPKSNTYMKKTKTTKIGLHVRFCNDKGRRSWTTSFENYYGKLDLLTKYPNCLTYIKNNQKLLNIWNSAVEEAENLKKLDGEARMFEFFKTFFSSDELNKLNCSTPSTLNNSSRDATSSSKVRTYSRKRSLTNSDQSKGSKLIKTEYTSVTDCSFSRSIDIPLLSKSDDADSTVSDISLDDVFVKTTHRTKKKRRSTKTYPPKNVYADKFNFSDFVNNPPEYDDGSEDTTISEEKTSITTRWIPKIRKIQINTVELKYLKKSSMNSSDSSHSSKKTVKSTKSDIETCSNNDDQNSNISLQSPSSSTSKKTAGKKTSHEKESSIGRKSVTVKNESSPEPDTTESETSSKNETYSTVFLASTKNKHLFVKSTKKACVVCKNITDTMKCSGPCQSYFHKECFNKSEERYLEPINKIISKRKKQCLKSTLKNEDSIVSSTIIENNSQEKSNVKSAEGDNFLSKPLNGMNSISEDNSKNDNLYDKQKSGDISNNLNGILVKNENTQLENINKDLIELKNEKKELIYLTNANKGLVPEISKEKTVDHSVKTENVTVEKVLKDDKLNMCSLCKANKTNCFLCGLNIEDPGQKIVCKLSNCGKYYHQKCLEEWPQCQWIQGLRNNVRCVICPHHVCHLCISDNPKSSCKTHFPTEKLIRCIKCPTAYHRSEYCLPAGSQVLTYFDIICSRHFQPSKNQNYHYNATWCFICTLGGTLVCCDLCPSSFHIKCLNQDPSEFEGGFTCEECQTGRYPLYGEIVWAKIGNYRWWPAQIIFPDQVPDSINAIPHSVGQFAVRFFGTYNYYWVNRGRVFNFHEGDDENILTKSTMKVIDQMYQDAVIEAAQAHNAYVLDKDKHDAIIAKQSLTKPPKYTRIKFNRPYGNVKNMELATTPMTSCECDPFKPNPCGPGSDCINRMLMFECQPQLCSAGDKCNNQRFEKVLYPAMEPFLTKGRGWGLRTLEDIKEGSFVIEYVGDVIDEEEFQRRCFEMHKRNEQNYYFLTIDNYRMIDAGPKGNLSRFMNHSCEPNCVTQKWTVNGDTRIGLFALHDIQAGTELVFDYRLESCSGVEKKPCQCGAARCSKFIGVKVEEEKKKVVPVNDADKCETSTKSKRKPLKIKENVSDSDKSKLSKEMYNGQDIPKLEIEVDESKAIKTEDDCNKSKTKISIGISSSAVSNIKKENSESSETLAVIKSKRKSTTRNTTNLIKNNTVNSSKSKGTLISNSKQGNCLSTLPKKLIKDGTSGTKARIRNKKGQFVNKKKMNLAKLKSLSKKSTKVTTTLPPPRIKGHEVVENNVEDTKSTSISKMSTENSLKTEQIGEVLENASVSKPNESSTPVSSRHSLSRSAKSRHLFLCKSDPKKDDTIIKPTKQLMAPKNNLAQDKVIVPKIEKTNKKCEKISLEKTVIVKQSKLNKHKLQNYCKNNSCSVCSKDHAELKCKIKKCPRVFHLSCMNKNKISKTGFICPSHFCSVCKKRKVVATCKCCVKSFCSTHVKENIFKDPLGHGMLCITHHHNKKPLPISSTLVTPVEILMCKNNELVDSANSRLGSTISKTLFDNQFNVDTDKMDQDKYVRTQVIKDSCDREYIHIGGFNVCQMTDFVADHGNDHSVPVNTDGDLFKPSSANVVIDIESASALYQSTDSLELVSMAIDNKYDYANVHFLPDVGQANNKWLASEP